MENRGMSKNGHSPFFYAGEIKKEKIFYLRAVEQMIFSMFLIAEKIENFFLS